MQIKRELLKVLLEFVPVKKRKKKAYFSRSFEHVVSERGFLPRLQVRDIECVADALNVRTEKRVGRPEERQNSVLHLSANFFSRPEGVFRRHILNVVDDGDVGQDMLSLVDLVYGVLEGQLGGRILVRVGEDGAYSNDGRQLLRIGNQTGESEE